MMTPPRIASSMAKSKPPEVRLFPTTEFASAKAREKIATLRKYYELGWRASDTAPDGTAKTPEPLKALAAEAEVEEDTIRKALKFATTYTAEELDDLLALRDADGEPLNWYRVRVLLQLKDKAVRAELQREAALGGWTQRDLAAAVHARQGGKKSPGGRRFSVPDSPQQVLGRLTELSDSWLRFYEDIGEEGGLAEKLRAAKRKGEWNAALRDAIREAADRLDALQKAALKAANRLEEVDHVGKGRGPGAGGRKANKTGADKL